LQSNPLKRIDGTLLSAIVDLELALCAVGAVDDDPFGLLLFDDGQVCAPTTRLSSVLAGFALGSGGG
jgi:hypothetical protein